LGGRVIHLENAQTFPQGGAVGVRIEARPEHHQLADPACDGSGQGLLGDARSHGNEQAQPSSGRMVFRIANRPFRVRPQDAHGQRVGEDTAPLQHLVDSAMRGGSERGAAWLPWPHRNASSSTVTFTRSR